MTPDRDALIEKMARAIMLKVQMNDFGREEDTGFVTSPRQIDLLTECCARAASIALDIAMEQATRVAERNAYEAWQEGADETRGLMRLQAQDIAAALRAYISKP